jgi:hypothetical protein
MQSRPAAKARQVEREAWRSARAFARKRELNTVSAKDRRSARTVFRKLASGGRIRALPQRLRRAGRATISIPGATWVSPPVLHPGRPALRRPPIQSGLAARAARSRSIRSRRRFGSPAERASLATGRGQSRTGPTYGGLGTLHFLEGERSQRVGGAGYADNRRTGSRASPPEPLSSFRAEASKASRRPGTRRRRRRNVRRSRAPGRFARARAAGFRVSLRSPGMTIAGGGTVQGSQKGLFIRYFNTVAE